MPVPLAHRRPEDGGVHALSLHSQGTADRAAAFASAWGAERFAWLAGAWHDLGKYAADVQAMLRGDAQAHLADGRPAGRGRIDHSSAGALWAQQRFGPSLGRLLAYVIAGHHGGLPDWEGGLQERLGRSASRLDAALAGGPPRGILDAAAPVAGPGKAELSLWLRMLASAVYDADFLDTEAFFDDSRAAARDGGWPGLDTLAASLSRHLAERFAAPPAVAAVDSVRAEVLAACRAAATRKPGLFSLTVPTGGGKTLSSLAFALDHARANGLRRVIYAVPFTSIIEQTAEVFRQAVGAGAVLEHHSALGPRPEEETARSRLAAENWDAPLIVTTTVQLFESLYGARPSRIRKLHNLAGSVIVLDEAQAVPAAVLRPVTAVLAELVATYGASVVLCTATQPEWNAVFRGFVPTEIAPDPPRLFAALDRVDIRLPQPGRPTAWAELAAAMDTRSLAIVNSRADCRRLHALLPEGSVHLSTWQCAAHRSRLIDWIKTRLDPGCHEPIRVVSTSLVEAGVDLDFDAVFRAMAGLDSLAQAAGRCNRHGRLAKGRFTVFRPEGEAVHGAMAQAAAAAEAALRQFPDRPFHPEAFAAYFRELYWVKGEPALDKYHMSKLLRLGRPAGGDPFSFQFRTAAEAFHLIEDDQDTLVVPYDRPARGAIAALRQAGPSRATLRQLQRYTVPLRPCDMQRLRESRAVDEVDGVAVLVAEELYRGGDRGDVGLDFVAL